MPNYCNNYITISGNEENMKPIFEYFQNSERITQEVNQVRRLYIQSGHTHQEAIDEYPYPENLVMNSLCPRDAEYQRIVDEGDFLLSPQSTFYGTKWDFDFIEANLNDLDETYISFSPMTAWSPCDKFCQKIAKKYGVQVSIDYEEPGNAYIGRATYDKDETLVSEYYDDTNYMRGLFILDRDLFWSRMESEIDTFILQYPQRTAIEYIELNIPFINEELVMEVEDLFNQVKNDHAESN